MYFVSTMIKKFTPFLFLALLTACQSAPVMEESSVDPEVESRFPNFVTDFSQHSIAYEDILSGGPGKDGIPAIDEPSFVGIEEADWNDEDAGVFLDIEGDQRFYPFGILVWHEIVNDEVGGEPVAVTFCPLCGTAIVFDREVEGELLDFGVSGYLYQSNLLMYDRQTESFWSQTLGRAVVGSYTDTELEWVSMQRLTWAEVKTNYPEAQVLSTDTGHRRDYGRIPYGNYDETEDLFFPVSIEDDSYFAKKLFLVVPVEGVWVAFPWDELREDGGADLELENGTLSVETEGSQTSIFYNGESMPSYFEMWFSFATHHQDDAVIWKP